VPLPHHFFRGIGGGMAWRRERDETAALAQDQKPIKKVTLVSEVGLSQSVDTFFPPHLRSFDRESTPGYPRFDDEGYIGQITTKSIL